MTVFMKFDDGSILQEESQRDSGAKPRVARTELPWENHWNKSQPQRGCVRDTHGAACRLAATPLGLIDHLGLLPRVARASQPWASRRNPFGILPARLNHHRIS